MENVERTMQVVKLQTDPSCVSRVVTQNDQSVTATEITQRTISNNNNGNNTTSNLIHLVNSGDRRHDEVNVEIARNVMPSATKEPAEAPQLKGSKSRNTDIVANYSGQHLSPVLTENDRRQTPQPTNKRENTGASNTKRSGSYNPHKSFQGQQQPPSSLNWNSLKKSRIGPASSGQKKEVNTRSSVYQYSENEDSPGAKQPIEEDADAYQMMGFKCLRPRPTDGGGTLQSDLLTPDGSATVQPGERHMSAQKDQPRLAEQYITLHGSDMIVPQAPTNAMNSRDYTEE